MMMMVTPSELVAMSTPRLGTWRGDTFMTKGETERDRYTHEGNLFFFLFLFFIYKRVL